MPATALPETVAALTGVALIEAARRRRRPSTPAELAVALIPGYVVTPTIALLSDVLADAIAHPGRRVIISAPPRSGKSVLFSQIGVLFALMADPDASVILASYGDDLAREHSHQARALVAEYPELLGFSLAPDKTSTARWRIEGRQGGLLATGIMSGVTGHGAALLLIDDPIKNAAEADSPAHRRRVRREFDSTLMTRLHPGASVCLIQSRWATDDLAGSLLAEEPGRWRHVNIPAISDEGIPDALDREAGVATTSALGRTRRELEDTRRQIGERTWWAMFEGVPAPPEGGVIRTEWLEHHRLPVAPDRPVRTVVGIDPSDSGRGDSCGIVAASLTGSGDVVVIRSVSRPMTSDEWARVAVEMAVEVGAVEISVESFAARETYAQVVTVALDAYRGQHPGAPSIRVTAWPPLGSGRGRGDALARSAALVQALERGGCRLAGEHPHIADAAATWQAQQHQPDVLAALVVAFDVLAHSIGQQWSFSSPVDVERRMRDGGGRQAPSWMARSIGGGGQRTWADMFTGNTV